jgi:hypothetical protein
MQDVIESLCPVVVRARIMAGSRNAIAMNGVAASLYSSSLSFWTIRGVVVESIMTF